MRYDPKLKVGDREIAIDKPTYFIADIASNHDGNLDRAIELLSRAKEAGADAAKFQHFKASQLVSNKGFEQLAATAEHQDAWGKTVFEIYEENEYQREWDEVLFQKCTDAGIHFMTSPYDLDAIDSVEPLVSAYKIGSGDITAIEIIERISSKSQPVFLACGASSMDDVTRAVEKILERTPRLALMQCNTNYTGSIENFRHINLNVLKVFSETWPEMILGLSDHTPGHSTVLAAVALGARCVEKHFTDDNSRLGPDHPFSMNPESWREMVNRTREVEEALGDGIKRVQDNEQETVIVQRRSLHLSRNMDKGQIVNTEDLVSLRPAPPDCFYPYERNQIIGQKIITVKNAGDPLYRSDIMMEK